MHGLRHGSAIRRYEDWVTRFGLKPYGLRKMPTDGHGHWHWCTLTSPSRNRPQMSDVMTYGRGMRVITQVSAAMLQGFQVDWDTFIPNDPGVYQWVPDSAYWTECPQVQLLLESVGLASDGLPTDSLDDLPRLPDLGDDVRPWDYIGQGR